MNKRVRIATTSSYPDGMASTYRIHCYAKGLLEEGVSIEVVSANATKKKEGKSVLFRGDNSQIPYTILWNREKFRRMFLNYLWAEGSSYLLMFHTVLTARRFDILWLYGMGLLPRLFLLPMMHLMGKTVVLELNEYPYSTEGNKYTRIPWIRKVLRYGTFKFILPRVEGVVVISENLYKVVRRHAPQVPVLKVPILIDKITSEQCQISSEEVLNMGIPYIFHAGSLSQQKDGIVKVFEAFALAANALRKQGKPLDFIITNEVTQPETWLAIQEILKKYHLEDNLKVTGYLDTEALNMYMEQANILVINKPISFQNKFNFPTKLGDYLLSGRPVVVAAENMELNNYLSNEINAIVRRPDDVEGIAQAIQYMNLNPVEARVIGLNGKKKALVSFNYKINGLRIKNFLQKIV